MRKRLGYVFMGMGAALLIAALALLFFNRAQDEKAGNAADKVMPVLIAAIEESMLETPSAEDGAGADSAAEENAPSAVGNPLVEAAENTDMTVAEVDGEEYIGYLSIISLGLELPVISQWDYEKLKTAPCRYYGSTKTDDLVICGHNYTRHFGSLKNLQAGDRVYFTDMDGKTIAYQVEVLEVLQPDQIHEMIESGYALTLYTCTYGGQTRVTVRCNPA